MLDVTFTPAAPYLLARSIGSPDLSRSFRGSVLQLAYPAGEHDATAHVWQRHDGSLQARIDSPDPVPRTRPPAPAARRRPGHDAVPAHGGRRPAAATDDVAPARAAAADARHPGARPDPGRVRAADPFLRRARDRTAHHPPARPPLRALHAGTRRRDARVGAPGAARAGRPVAEAGGGADPRRAAAAPGGAGRRSRRAGGAPHPPRAGAGGVVGGRGDDLRVRPPRARSGRRPGAGASGPGAGRRERPRAACPLRPLAGSGVDLADAPSRVPPGTRPGAVERRSRLRCEGGRRGVAR